ncbi:MAG: redoxin domain-containing protein [Nitrososphaerales archaeon]|jgi:peroxiredoxin
MPQVGETAPGFTLYDSDKKVRSLDEFVGGGKRTILAFYPGAFTGTCTQEMCTFRDMFSDLQKMDATLVGISVDAPFAQKAFAEKYGLKFPLLCDFKREVVQRYGLVWHNLGDVQGYDTSNRAVFVLDGSGRVVYSWVATNPGVLPAFEAIVKSLA